MINLKGRSDFTELQGDRYDFCHICGPQTYRVVVHFDSGSVAPTIGETVTGVTSGHTGVVENVVLVSGEYLGRFYGDGYYGTFFYGDTTTPAVGVLFLTSPTGYNSDTSKIFVDDEALNGSISGSNFATVNGQPGINRSGRLHPDWNLVTYRGQKFCREHFEFKFRREWEDEAIPNLNENERGK